MASETEAVTSPIIVSYIHEKFVEANNAKQEKTARFLECYNAYKGKYGSEVVFSDPEQSRVFVKITKTKVIAAFGQVSDVLFGTGTFPLEIQPTPMPIGIAEFAYVDPMGQGQQPEQESMPDSPFGYEGDGNSLSPGATLQSLLGGLEEKYKGLPLKEGPAPDGKQMLQIEPAVEAARNMNKVIQDQLVEGHVKQATYKALFECVLFGTGIIKGPMVDYKTYHRWSRSEDGSRTYDPIDAIVPSFEFVSVFDFYPDPFAYNMDEAEYVIQRKRLNKSQLLALRGKPFFINKNIERLVGDGGNYEKLDHELFMNPNTENTSDMYDVKIFWGTVDIDILSDLNKDIRKQLDIDKDEVKMVSIEAWVSGNEYLRIIVNPFIPKRIPYFVIPYEIDPYNIFGVGVAENMSDSQQIMNGTVRMAIDNLRWAGNAIFELADDSLVPGQDFKIRPGKVFRKQIGMNGPALNAVKVEAVTQQNLMVFDRVRQWADEETGIPSYSHGTTGVMSTTRTSSGMSMLMGAAALNIKTVIKNIDDYYLTPLGEALFQWNMQFNEKEDIEGDLEVKALGSVSLMRKEVQSQRLMTFGQLATNPQIAPWIKWHTYIEEVARSLDLPVEQLLANPEEAAIYAKIIGLQNQAQQVQQTAPETSPTDQSGVGGGNIGVGAAPVNGEPGFTGSDQSVPPTTGMMNG